MIHLWKSIQTKPNSLRYQRLISFVKKISNSWTLNAFFGIHIFSMSYQGLSLLSREITLPVLLAVRTG